MLLISLLFKSVLLSNASAWLIAYHGCYWWLICLPARLCILLWNVYSQTKCTLRHQVRDMTSGWDSSGMICKWQGAVLLDHPTPLLLTICLRTDTMYAYNLSEIHSFNIDCTMITLNRKWCLGTF